MRELAKGIIFGLVWSVPFWVLTIAAALGLLR